jgi:hypothetical protein
MEDLLDLNIEKEEAMNNSNSNINNSGGSNLY